MKTRPVPSTPHSLLEQAALASKLLTQEQIDCAWEALVAKSVHGDQGLDEISERALADHLVELGYLNRWQAEQLLQGRTKFTLGPYRIHDAIGRGGMGYVFQGEHQLLGRIEAIKVLPRTQMTPASIESFCREIRAQAQLDHPNLIRLSFADRDGDTYYLVSEFVPGSDLRRLVRRYGPLTNCQAAWVVSQAAEALAYVHERGLVHRDVKPSNLLITPAGQTKLADLGLAAFADETLRPPAAGQKKHIVGTPDFLSPEAVVSPGAARPISDIYSLGCTLYYALTGKVPFPGGRTSDKIKRHVELEPTPVSRLNAHVEPDLAALLAEMTRKQPGERIACAAAVVERLRPWVERLSQHELDQLGQRAEEAADAPPIDGGLADTLPAEDAENDTARSGQPGVPSASETADPAAPAHGSGNQWGAVALWIVVTGLAAGLGAAAVILLRQ